MKKSEIILLANAGIQSITNHSLDTAQAYKVVKFRKAFNAALDAIAEDQKALLKESGIGEDTQSFNKEMDELRKANRTPEQEAKLKEMEAQLKRYNEMNGELLKEEVTLDTKTMPYEAWHTLQNENKAVGEPKRDLLSGFVEDLLEGVLWVAPEEEE
ncbi:MAG: hypothetical protein J6T35_03580 [Bacteroidales bacterium]|nr:hypothetical protein [Bacteroidales bacterium]